MNPIIHIFKNKSLEIFNDDVLNEIFDLTDNDYTFLIRPTSNTYFWRFGIALSIQQYFEFYPSSGRYDDKQLKFIEIDVGDKQPSGTWILPNKIALAARNIENYEGYPKVNETYIPYSGVQLQIRLDSLGNINIVYDSDGINDAEKYPIIGYNYFKVFAWADEIEFEFECKIIANEKFESINKNTPDLFWLLKFDNILQKNFDVNKLQQFIIPDFFNLSANQNQIKQQFAKVKKGGKGIGYFINRENVAIYFFDILSPVNYDLQYPAFEFKITTFIDFEIPFSEFQNEITITQDLKDNTNNGLLEITEENYKHISDKKNDQFEDKVDILNDGLSNDDLLARIPFVNALAEHIENLWKTQGDEAYTIHLGGEWGSGKSNVLNFLEKRFEHGKENSKKINEIEWLVVRYNAWENQRINPPWWIFMNNVYEGIWKKENLFIKSYIWLKERFWRIFGIKKSYWISFLIFGITSWFLIVHFNLFSIYYLNQIPKSTDDLFKAIVTIFSILGTFWSIFKGVSNNLLPGSSEAAVSFQKNIKDPMAIVKNHYKNIIAYSKKNIAVFIDDIDRCGPENTVNLLEGIQTLFKSTKVLYIVSGDGNWIRQCFELSYDKFKSVIEKPGYTLGNFFQEKIFQMSINVPVISEKIIKSFWNSLIKNQMENQTDFKETKQKKLNKAREELQNKNTETEINEVIRSKQGEDDEIIYREAAVEQFSNKTVQENIKHKLTNYAIYLPSNPRSLKRLINNYALARQILILQGTTLEEVNTDSLVRWILLSSKFPQFAERISKNLNELESPEFNNVNGFSDLINSNLNKNVIRSIIGK